MGYKLTHRKLTKFLKFFKMSLELASLNELLKHANECHNRQNDINIHVVNANIECDQVFR